MHRFVPVVMLMVGICGCGGAYRAQEFGVLKGVPDSVLESDSAAEALFERTLAALPAPQTAGDAPPSAAEPASPQGAQVDLFQAAAQIGIVGETANAAAIDVVSNVVDLLHLALRLDAGVSLDKQDRKVLWNPAVASDLKHLAKQLKDARSAQRSAANKGDARDKLEKLQDAFAEFNILLDSTIALLGNGGSHVGRVSAQAGPLLQWMRVEHSHLKAEVAALLTQMPKPQGGSGLDIGLAFLSGASGFGGFGQFGQIGPAVQGVQAITQVTRVRQPVMAYPAPVIAQQYTQVQRFVPAPFVSAPSQAYAFHLNIARQQCHGAGTAVGVDVHVRR